VQGGWIVRPGEVEIERQIGVGSVGAVYKGKHIASGKDVAVKVRNAPDPVPPTPSVLRELLRESESSTHAVSGDTQLWGVLSTGAGDPRRPHRANAEGEPYARGLGVRD